ncbi:hypothetical protein [Microcystis aeruginosa]|uniref:hypothetical protein n=1 Tax=Microcystis aeruginosa TaxID=1126 RepID=UPI00232C11F4|nr:hypothetical protein [Microcystis aeruginosa]MDB9412340.1 hypothetical protein [Microcystis aeruginosa CS-567/02]
MLKRKSFFDKIDQMCCEESLQISYWGWETVNYLGFTAKSCSVGTGGVEGTTETQRTQRLIAPI